IDQAKALNDDNFRIVNHYHELEDRFQKAYTSCPFVQFLTVIGADGGVYSCQDKAFTSAGLLGSIRDQSFKEFWYSEQNRLAMQAINPAKDCVHHCIAHGKNLAILDLLDLDPDHASFV
ncbi:MAG TPA: radical SAM protein, partial [Rhodospirillales bacterium]|nr:radical SAM protein [Rhodospirillales bacterium]